MLVLYMQYIVSPTVLIGPYKLLYSIITISTNYRFLLLLKQVQIVVEELRE